MTQGMKMNNQLPGYPLRMPPELRQWFDAAAKRNGRSLNSELVHCLAEIQAKSTQSQPAQQPSA